MKYGDLNLVLVGSLKEIIILDPSTHPFSIKKRETISILLRMRLEIRTLLLMTSITPSNPYIRNLTLLAIVFQNLSANEILYREDSFLIMPTNTWKSTPTWIRSRGLSYPSRLQRHLER